MMGEREMGEAVSEVGESSDRESLEDSELE